MKYKEFVGIDVSQATLDIVVHGKRAHKQFINTDVGRKKILPWLRRIGVHREEVLSCFGNTGIFSIPLLGYLAENKAMYVQISGLEAKRSMGIKRDKTDKVDATALAEYAYRNREDLKADPPPNKVLAAAKRLFSLRALLVKQRAGIKARLKTEVRMLGLNKRDPGLRIQGKAIKELTTKIGQLETEIMSLIAPDPPMMKNYELATSIKGIGRQTATFMLITMGNFTLFANWRKYACEVVDPIRTGSDQMYVIVDGVF